MLANFVPSGSKGLEPHWLTDTGASPPWPARTTIKRTRRALERWIEDRKVDFSIDGFEIAQLALSAGELDQPRAEKMTLIVQSVRARLLTFIEVFDQHPA